ICPIVLSVVNVKAEVFNEFLVHPFGLAICLWMICSRIDPIYFSHKPRHELGTAVTNNLSREAMFFKDKVSIKSGCPFTGDIGVGGYEIRLFSEPVDHYHDRVISLGFWKRAYKIYGNGMPGFRWNFIRVEGCSFSLAVWFICSTTLTSFDISFHVRFHVGPPVVSGNKLNGFSYSRVAFGCPTVAYHDDEIADFPVNRYVDSFLPVD
ncbi:hypothetical protein AMATHDRAFT_166221, partial [Amanita thiersii Skay4041]